MLVSENNEYHTMEEGDVLVFNPASEFQVIEEFTFDELIERPAETRFYTLTEQTTDFLNKILPQTGKKIPKAALQKAEHEIEAFKLLYSRHLQETETGFDQTGTTRPTSLPWVTYAYNKEPLKTNFVWKNWIELYSGLKPNYYLTLLDTLPKNGIYYPDAEGKVVYDAIVNNRKALGEYTYTKTAYREDGTYTVQPVKRPDTQDIATFTGYTIGVPNPPPPNPLADHPFLGIRTEPLTLETSEPLSVILPSVDAILQHAVPRTSNPYKDAPPYLNPYKLTLEDIPWNLWKESFPPMDLIEEGAPPSEIAIKRPTEDAPAKALLDIYKTTWYPGLSTRAWLSTQLDGGTLVSRILLSRVATQAPIAIPPPIVIPDATPIEGSAEDCLPSVVTQFSDFAMRGVYRAHTCAVCGWVGHGASECPDRKGPVSREYKPDGGCLPLSFVTHEREEAPFKEKKPWVPGTDAQILKEYQQYIAQYTEKFIDIISSVPKADPSLGISETRQFILDILSDETRTPEDKGIDITAILHDTEHTLSKHIYKEETGQFLICEHTLDQLSGSYEANATEFLKRWSVSEKGFSVCQSCGEPIAEVLEAQDEFDENGRVIQYRSKLDTSSFHPTEHASFASSLKNLQSILDLKEPAEDILYLLLCLLQVLPEEEQLKPILDYTRTETAKVRAKISGKKLTSKQTSDVELALGVFGFNALVILLQTHRPQLLPRKSFGGKPLVLKGFPRDGEETPLIDGLLSVLSKTFEEYPSTFKGSSVVLLRTLLNDRKGVRKVVLNSLTKQFVPVFSKKLQEARDMLDTVDVSYVLQNAFQPPIVRPEKDVSFLAPEEGVSSKNIPRFRCRDPSLAWLTPSTPFSFRQKELTIEVPLKPSSKATKIARASVTEGSYTPTVEEVRSRIKLKVPDVTVIKKVVSSESPELLRSVLLEWTNAISSASTVSQDLKTYIRSIRKNIENAVGDPSLLRDYFRGLISEMTSRAIVDTTIKAILERSATGNIGLRSLLTKIDESKKMIDTLRAKERETFKARMRSMPDAQRDITKTLIDKGLAPYLITKEDRDMFVQEIAETVTEVTTVTDIEQDRDDGPQGEVPVGENGEELQTDYGGYGDRRARAEDGEEYAHPGEEEGSGF